MEHFVIMHLTSLTGTSYQVTMEPLDQTVSCGVGDLTA